ncbi:MAG TPA: hypothetical protein VLY03_03080 [Bacteroidota bacterium]|nr:hypothetical protein [Bacteroidota bacterium]
MAVRSQTNYSCCKTHLIADRSKTDAVTSQDSKTPVLSGPVNALFTLVTILSHESPAPRPTSTSPPLLSSDLSLLNASLLL